MIIKTIESNTKLKEIFNFMSKNFYEESKEFNEHYYTMSERFNEMVEQFNKENSLLLYVEEGQEIVAALTSKSMDEEQQKITLGIIVVSKEYRRKGYAKALIKEFERKCIEKNIKHIELGSRFRACPLYLSLNYSPSLMVQVFDFATIDDIKNANKFSLEIISEFQSDTNEVILFKVPEVNEKYIKYFEKNVQNSHVQYIFKKDLF